jgi:glycosyltransferase involved in cell wall biosynthesis
VSAATAPEVNGHFSDVREKNPLVSVIICTRNRRELVTRAIDSVLAQEFVTTEVIVVDDYSEDGTVAMLREHYGSRIVVIPLDTNRRVAYASNTGFEQSHGEFIALLGDDDYWSDSKKLIKQLTAFEEMGSKLGVVGTWWTERHDSGELILRNPEDPNDWENRLLKGGGVISGSTALISRAAWIAAGGLDERMPRGTDSDLFRRIILCGYAGKVLQHDTTVVDVGHGLTRMTTKRGYREAKRTAYVHAYLLWKYRKHYLLHPSAFVVRLRSLILTPLIAILR